ncbi:hypothetical protein BG53_00345 [Paenibacillus darwinianus]|uniref:Uncharacterized protein n=1 Tax=Paenibacillus darwinianus TaxID=1380763 RepID=A0A9W5S241_9BACL|nr:hypothetical protein [Paenibacillus darwinianus]EXX88467.1 hypothetical protein BG52_02030 [Paenibacillus darwinianus]EXX89285.1 hypothetical protein BG53_00345 [Paenibacillus darwinianus]EXX90001.1 hypothetical protein CH50_00430 [Paenibacillus darwinianus]
MDTKRCLFCDQIVPTETNGGYDWYIGCYCSPVGRYGLLSDSYETYYTLPLASKRRLDPLFSAYIRELTDCGETVRLTAEDIDTLEHSPRIPATIDGKANRLLQYLHRHCGAAYEPVVIHPLAVSYNLTYSMNLQELIYIIEMLKERELIERSGSTFRLTKTGWLEAVATAEGRNAKPCLILVPDDEEKRNEWGERVIPSIAQCGYAARLNPRGGTAESGTFDYREIAQSKLLLADLSGHAPEVYFAAGYALGLQIPVIWTLKRREADARMVRSELIRPILWDEPEELAALLQQRLSV